MRHATSGVVFEWLNAHGIRNSKGRRAKLRNRRMQQLVTTVALHDTLADDNAAPAALDAVAGLRPLMDEAMSRYGTQNPLVSHLVFLARVLDVARYRCHDVHRCKNLRGFVRAGPFGDWL